MPLVATVNRVLKTVANHIAAVTGINRSHVRITVNTPTYFDWFDASVAIIPQSINVRRYFGSEVTAGGNIAAGPASPFVELHFRCVVTTFEYLDETGTCDIAFDDTNGHFYYIKKVFEALNGTYITGDGNNIISIGSIAVISIEPIARVVNVEPDRRKDYKLNRGQLESSINCYVAFALDSWPGSLGTALPLST